MSDEKRIYELTDRLEAEIGALQAIEALRLATSALASIAEARTLSAATTTAKGALLGVRKHLSAEGFNRVAERVSGAER